MPKLLINEGGQASVFELFDDEATIGRGASNAIQIVDSHASKHHAVIRRAGGRVKLVDLESKNGTRVNGEFRNQRWLQHGDAVSIGSAVLTYDGSDGAAVAEAPVPAAAFVGGGAGHAIAAPVAAGAAPRSRRDRERDRDRDRRHGDDDDDDRPRRPVRRQANNAGTVLLVGGGLLAVVAVFFLLLSGKGNPNVNALAYARELSRRDTASSAEHKANVQAAIDHLTQHGVPSEVDSYRSVAAEIEKLRQDLLAVDEADTDAEALKEYKAIERSFIEMWKNGKTEDVIGQELLKWAAKYKDARIVASFQAGNWDKKLLALFKKTQAGGTAPPR